MFDRFVAAAIDHLLDHLIGRQVMLFGKKLRNRVVIQFLVVVGGCVQLDAVARAQQHQLRRGKLLAKGTQRITDLLVVGKGNPFSKFDGSIVVAAADHLQLHVIAPAVERRVRCAASCTERVPALSPGRG